MQWWDDAPAQRLEKKEVQWSYHIVGFNRVNLTNLARGLQRQLLKRHWQLLQKQSWKQRDAMTWRIDSESDEEWEATLQTTMDYTQAKLKKVLEKILHAG